MKKINLYLMDMCEDMTTSGVNRYMENILFGLSRYSDIQTFYIRLLHSSSLLLPREKKCGHYHEFIIPLPFSMGSIIDEQFWSLKYCATAYHLIRHLFDRKERVLIHIHTLNLIDFALYIKQYIDCRIITHLHCIPWKGLYNINMRKFNELYASEHVEPLNKLIQTTWELKSYVASDRIICVTECGRNFIKKSVSERLPPINVIPNGMDDLNRKKEEIKDSVVELLYVGNLSPSKGLRYVLEALRIVYNKGYEVRLNIVGLDTGNQIHRLSMEFFDLNLNFTGNISLDELTEYYKHNNIGILASLQEQASYVAIEMAMFGLPIITTNVDGLDEMFTNGIDALKIETTFSKVKGLKVKVEEMAKGIISLIENESERLRLAQSARLLYEEKFRLCDMMEKTVETYYETL